MKLTVQKLLDLRPSLQKLIAQDLPVKVSYRISKSLKGLNNELETYDSSRKVLFEKYGEKNADGNLEIKKENMEAFVKDNNELLLIEIETVVDKIKLSELEGAKLSPADMFILGELIEE